MSDLNRNDASGMHNKDLPGGYQPGYIRCIMNYAVTVVYWLSQVEFNEIVCKRGQPEQVFLVFIDSERGSYQFNRSTLSTLVCLKSMKKPAHLPEQSDKSNKEGPVTK